MDRCNNQLVVKDTFSNVEIYRIPHHYMNLETGNVSELMNHFKWVNEDVIQLISADGIE